MRVVLERVSKRFFEAHGLPRYDMHERPALNGGKGQPIDVFLVLLFREDQTSSRASKGLVRISSESLKTHTYLPKL